MSAGSPSPPARRAPPAEPRWIEPWYVAFALLGVSTDAMASILLPLAAAPTAG